MLKKAQHYGFKTYLYFVFTDDPDINIERVNLRAKGGGHSVAKEKIGPRYKRSLHYLSDAVTIADESYLIDNSFSINNSFNSVAEIEKGQKFRSVKKGYNFKKILPAFYKKFKGKIK